MANNAVYWVGADGNVYVKGPSGVKNAGKVSGVQSDSGVDAQSGSFQAKRIADPNPPRATVAQTAPTSGSSSSAATTTDRSNDIAQQNAGLAAVGTQTQSGINAVNAALARVLGSYDAEASAAASSAKSNSDQNTINLQKNKQTALVNAAQGRQGLNSTLASLGALNGSGIELATRAVQKGANDDLTGASDNYDTNQQQIDTALGTFKAQDKERRSKADADAANARTAVQNEGAKSQLGYYQNLSNDYAAQGDAANASKYSSLAASLFPTIASTTVPSAGPSYSAAAYTAPTLGSYLAGSGGTNVSVTPSSTGGIPGLVATNTKKKTAASVAA